MEPKVAPFIGVVPPCSATPTKKRMLDAAEALFMEHGFEATCVRTDHGRRPMSTSPPSITTSAARKSCSRRC